MLHGATPPITQRRATFHYDPLLRSIRSTVPPPYVRYIIKDTSSSDIGARTWKRETSRSNRVRVCLIVDATRGHGTICGKHVHGVGVDALLHTCNTVDGDNNSRSNAACTVEDVCSTRTVHTRRAWFARGRRGVQEDRGVRGDTR